jgi:DNA-binding winged helix-turn-helix (wHTH) protein
MSESEEYLFDHFCLSVRPGADGPAEVRLYSKGRPQTLTQQEAKTLQILVERQGLFVETNTLAREVCGDDRADEGVIHTAVSGLRRIFNDPAKVGEFIRNERKKGYCFVKAVRKAGDGESVEETPAQAEGAGAQTARPVEEPLSVQADDEESALAQSAVAHVAAEDLKDQVISFRELWLSAGRMVRWVVSLGIVLTVAVSVVAVMRGWQGIDDANTQSLILAYASTPQLFMLLFAIAYVLPGPRRLDEGFGKAAGYETPLEGDDARYIAERALGRYTIYWRGILAFWLFLYCCLVFIEPGGVGAGGYPLKDVSTTLFNNLSTAMFVLCYNVLNQPVEIKAGRREISDTPWLLWSMTLVVAFLLVEVVTWRFFPSQVERERLLYACGLVSGIVGAIGMALYMGRLQSKFLGPSPWLVIALYSYTAIQPLFIFLVNVPKGKQVFDAATVTLIAVVLVNIALILKCMLYLYIALLFKSGSLLFYFVKVKRIYLNVDRERQEFRKFLKWEG